jgi:tetratricopeptide (TPR) repeat protein
MRWSSSVATAYIYTAYQSQTRRAAEVEAALAATAGANAGHDIENPEEMIGLYEQALAMNPGNQELMFSYGELLFDLGRFPEAATWFGRVAALSPNDTMTALAYGTALYGSGQVGTAIEEFERVLTINPEDTLALRNLVLLHLEQPRNIPAAENALRQIEEIDPNYDALPTLRDRLAAAR